MSAIRIKVPTASIVKALEDRLSENEKAQKEQEAVNKKHEEAMRKYAAEVYAVLTKNKSIVERVSVSTWRNEVEISFKPDSKLKFPEAPNKPNTDSRSLNDWQVKEIENALTLLRMTTEPTISASAYKDVVQYL
jgi:hypothetical protein